MPKTRPPIRTLHIDKEGGWGGSSSSLFELVSRLDRSKILPTVILGQDGPAMGWYRDCGVDALLMPEVASFVPRDTKYFRNLAVSLPSLFKLNVAASRISSVIEQHRIQLVHLNYEGLFLLGRQLKKRIALPIVSHSRAVVGDNILGQWLARSLTRISDNIFFISPNERDRFLTLSPHAAEKSEILFNISRSPYERVPFSDPPEAVFLGALNYAKGADRLIDIAAALQSLGAPPLRIVAYGVNRLDPGFAGRLQQRIDEEGLRERIVLCGHTSDPMRAMSGALALLRPSRGNDPWGRDVIEAAAAGVPVLATGSYEGIVRHGDTGFLFPQFDMDAMARRLIELLESPGLWQKLSAAAAARAREHFSGGAQVRRFTEIVERAVCKPCHGN
jgi:glycosyltransferase involved in cell wall biosynthesis